MWPRVCPPWRVPLRAPPAAQDAAWSLLWSPGVSERAAEELSKALPWTWEASLAAVKSALYLRLVYPDGSVHERASTFVETLSVLSLSEIQTRARKLER